MLLQNMAKELGAFGIRFAAIAPGFLDTPSTHKALSDNLISRMKQQIPLHKLGNPESVFLAAKSIIENEYINGTILEVDGGLVL